LKHSCLCSSALYMQPILLLVNINLFNTNMVLMVIFLHVSFIVNFLSTYINSGCQPINVVLFNLTPIFHLTSVILHIQVTELNIGLQDLHKDQKVLKNNLNKVEEEVLDSATSFVPSPVYSFLAVVYI
jgi:hypothetical protein